MEFFRRFILIFLIPLFGLLTFVYFFHSVKDPTVLSIIATFAFMFLLTIFNAILSSSANFYLSAVTHIITMVFLFAFLYFGTDLNDMAVIIFSLIYLIFQLLGYFHILRFIRDKLKINWINIFKINWAWLSWSMMIIITLLFLIKFDTKIIESGVLKDLIKKTEPIFTQLNLPSPNSKIQELMQIQDSGEQTEQIQKFQKQLQQMQGFEGVTIPKSEDLAKSGIESLSNQLNLHLTGNETIADIVVLYINKFWKNLSANTKLVVKLMVAILIITTFQPIFWILGNILGVIAWPLILLLGKLDLFSKETEEVVKEKIVI